MAERDRFREEGPFRDEDWNRDFGRRREQSQSYGRGRGDFDQGWGRERDEPPRNTFQGGLGRDGTYRSDERGHGDQDRGSGGRGRDFGDSAGYGTGGSSLDYRDVVGEDSRERGRGAMDRAFGQGFGRGPAGPDEERGWRDRSRNEGGRQDRGSFERAGDEGSWFGADEPSGRRGHEARPGGTPQHRGRGPRNYQRSDARILEDVNDRLTDDPHLDATHVEVTVQNREVTLDGTVRGRSEKRHAEDIVHAVSGVAHVQNNLRVQQGSAGPGQSSPPGDDRSTGGILP